MRRKGAQLRRGARPKARMGLSTVSAGERERMMEIIINAAPGLMAYWDLDLRCRFASRGYAEWFGLPSTDDIIGMSQEELLPQETYWLNAPLIRAVLAGVAQQFEREFLKPGDILVHTLTHYVPDVVDGEVVGFTTHVTDVTRLKESEGTLRTEVEERQRANKIIRSAMASLEEAQRLGQIGSWSWAIEPDLTVWSRELYRILGQDPSQPSPSFADHGEIYEPESWKRLQDAVSRALAKGEPYRLNLRIRRPDGRPGLIDARGEVVRDAQGLIIGLRGTARNISEAEETA